MINKLEKQNNVICIYIYRFSKNTSVKRSSNCLITPCVFSALFSFRFNSENYSRSTYNARGIDRTRGSTTSITTDSYTFALFSRRTARLYSRENDADYGLTIIGLIIINYFFTAKKNRTDTSFSAGHDGYLLRTNN